jgi:hypothetical protein
MTSGMTVIPRESIGRRIFPIRGHRVALDSDLATLYGVAIKRLNEQVRRNKERFPEDFAFQLTVEEYESLRSQFATLDIGRGRHRKYMPWAFTEHGALMAASVLNSPQAVEMSIFVVRAFVQLRATLVAHRHLSAKLAELERKYARHDKEIAALFEALHRLMDAPSEPKAKIGFRHGPKA